jgi:DNA-directed RNA polymerase subunit RPC12/RpoP
MPEQVILCPKCASELVIDSVTFSQARQLECPNCGNIFPIQSARVKNADYRKCVSCGNEVPKEEKKCTYCGKQFLQIKQQRGAVIQCPYCAEEISIDADVCPYCNKKLIGQEKEKKSQKPTPQDVMSSLTRSVRTRKKKSNLTNLFVWLFTSIFLLLLVALILLWKPDFVCDAGTDADCERARNKMKMLDVQLSKNAASYKEVFTEAEINAYLFSALKERKDIQLSAIASVQKVLVQLKETAAKICLEIRICGVHCYVILDGIPAKKNGALPIEITSSQVGMLPMLPDIVTMLLEKCLVLKKIFERELLTLNKTDLVDLKDGNVTIGKIISQTFLTHCTACNGTGSREVRQNGMLKSTKIVCPVCGGNPVKEVSTTKNICSNCGGFGKVLFRLPQYKTMDSSIITTNCPVCGGTGFVK